MRTPPSRYRRSAVDLTGSQSGDHQSRDAAGGDIYQGADPGDVFDLVRYLWEDRQQRDVRRAELDAALSDMRDQIELYRITLSQRLAAVTLAVETLAASAERQAEEARRLRRWAALLALVLLAVVAVEAALVWRELAAAGRTLYDAVLPALAHGRSP